MTREPYRALFPLGLLWGIVGVGIWLIYFQGWISIPVASHSYIMIFGFFMSFVSGFLMTALPKMKGAQAASRFEKNIALTLISSGVALALLGHLPWAYATSAGHIGFLMWFGISRPHSKGGSVHSGFIFIPAAFIWAAFGAVVFALHLNSVILISFARVAVQEAFLLNLIVGIGSRLIPFLTRVQSVAPTEQVADGNLPFVKTFVLLNLSFILEGAGYERTAWSLRAAVLVLAATALFKLHRPRPALNHLANGLFLSICLMIAGYLLLAVLPTYRIALLHLIFIGGFSLVTLMVATRVVLAHGGFSLEIERRSIFVAAAAGLLLAAALVRGFYFLPAAACLWLTAVAAWFFGIGRKVFQ